MTLETVFIDHDITEKETYTISKIILEIMIITSQSNLGIIRF